MKIIFLDIDGVLNSVDSKICELGVIGIDDDKLRRVKTIVEKTGAEIVLTSSWKLLHESVEYLDKRMSEVGIAILDKTEDNGSDRGHGVLNWIEKHRSVKNWVILDDEWFDYKELGLETRVIKTSFSAENGGLQDKHVELAIELLNSGDKND